MTDDYVQTFSEFSFLNSFLKTWTIFLWRFDHAMRGWLTEEVNDCSFSCLQIIQFWRVNFCTFRFFSGHLSTTALMVPKQTKRRQFSYLNRWNCLLCVNRIEQNKLFPILFQNVKQASINQTNPVDVCVLITDPLVYASRQLLLPTRITAGWKFKPPPPKKNLDHVFWFFFQ